jgi:NADH/NAD ratio-sensing transcriptional regulator Rex
MEEGMAIKGDTNDLVTIPKTVFKRLIESEKFLEALQAAGVDNWEGYEYAVEALEDD